MDLSLQSRKRASGINGKVSVTSSANKIKDLPHTAPKNLPQEIVSKNWLRSNVQNTWWNELDWHQHKVDSNLNDAHLYEIWRKNILQSNKIIGTLSEYQACREILWMFHAVSPMALFQEENQAQFSIREVSIPSLTTVSLYYVFPENITFSIKLY